MKILGKEREAKMVNSLVKKERGNVMRAQRGSLLGASRCARPIEKLGCVAPPTYTPGGEKGPIPGMCCSWNPFRPSPRRKRISKANNVEARYAHSIFYTVLTVSHY
ncbi:hypothetical protein JTE90_007768 [Oedothorax gibbosus]|uniref:Uncharacterized protein n=1 Tax=Oedothorax gibbosus TaxID=931172 RepID=A0AAV6TKK9_9ARAC|nr:hypothetical protein JTE90_007768 [Oedothorax gibbosus]